MSQKEINTRNLRDKLNLYGYRFNESDNTFPFYRTAINPVKISFGEIRIKVQGYFLRTRFFNRIELSFLVYFVLLQLSLEIQGKQGLILSVFVGVMLFILAVLFIHLEIIKSRVYSWLEQTC